MRLVDWAPNMSAHSFQAYSYTTIIDVIKDALQEINLILVGIIKLNNVDLHNTEKVRGDDGEETGDEN